MYSSCQLTFHSFLQAGWPVGSIICFGPGARRMGEKHAGSILARLALVLMKIFIAGEARAFSNAMQPSCLLPFLGSRRPASLLALSSDLAVASSERVECKLEVP